MQPLDRLDLRSQPLQAKCTFERDDIVKSNQKSPDKVYESKYYMW